MNAFDIAVVAQKVKVSLFLSCLKIQDVYGPFPKENALSFTHLLRKHGCVVHGLFGQTRSPLSV